MKNQIVFIIVFLSINHIVIAQSQCKCSISTQDFPGSEAISIDTLSISSENETLGQIDLGKLISYGSNLILQQTFQVQQNSNVNLVNQCPLGYVPLTKDDLQVLINRNDFSELINQNYLNLDFSKQTYYSSTKVHPEATYGGQNEAYIYYTLSLDDKNEPFINQQNTYWDTKERQTICKRIHSSFSVSLEGYEGYDLEQGKTYEIKVVNKNIQKYFIEDNNGNIFTTQTFQYTHQGNEEWGCATLNFRFQIFYGQIVGDCLSIWTKPQFAYNADSNISIDQIKKVTLENVKANVNNQMFFSPGSAPIAPITNDQSSFYVFYSEVTTNALKVQQLSKEGTLLGNPIDTQETGQPFDIVSTEFGFVIMARDSTQKLWIQAINKDGSHRWKRILSNNGDKPNYINDQIKFYKNDKCELPFGIQLMYNPHNGRLNYARGKIQAIWAHYNHFGYQASGNRDDHTGDTMISLDADTGFDQKLFWSWGASHSLYQSLHYDGKYLYVASLGDAYPMNILFKVCDIDLYTCKQSSTIIKDEIPGNRLGMSSGRQGSFIDIIGNREEKFFIYQRTFFQGEVAIIRLNKDLQLLSTKSIFIGNLARRVNNIKAVRYGKNILVAFTLIPQAEVKNYNRQIINQQVDESYLTLLDGSDGSIIYQPTKFSQFQVNSSDDWRVLEDGRIVYTIIDNHNNLHIYITPPLITPIYPNPIKYSDVSYGYGSLINNKEILSKNHYNDICLEQDDSNWNTIDFDNSIKNKENNKNIYDTINLLKNNNQNVQEKQKQQELQQKQQQQQQQQVLQQQEYKQQQQQQQQHNQQLNQKIKKQGQKYRYQNNNKSKLKRGFTNTCNNYNNKNKNSFNNNQSINIDKRKKY